MKYIKMIRKDLTLIIPIMLMGIILGYFISMACFMRGIVDLEKENKELRLEKVKLENRINELDYKQAEQTKKTAEMNGIGG